MDDLIAVLEQFSQLEDRGPSFTITNNSVIIRVEALTRGLFMDPGDAFASAREFTEALLATGYVAVNVNSIGAQIPTFEDNGRWRGSIDLVLRPVHDLGENFRHATGLGTA